MEHLRTITMKDHIIRNVEIIKKTSCSKSMVIYKALSITNKNLRGKFLKYFEIVYIIFLNSFLVFIFYSHTKQNASRQSSQKFVSYSEPIIVFEIILDNVSRKKMKLIEYIK